jgi:hypothetical protein
VIKDRQFLDDFAVRESLRVLKEIPQITILRDFI